MPAAALDVGCYQIQVEMRDLWAYNYQSMYISLRFKLSVALNRPCA